MIPYTGSSGRSDTALRFEIEIAEDRGAVLGSYKLEQFNTMSLTNSLSAFITREINGGRAF